MNKELTERLYTKYPLIFVEKDLPKTETCMCWGFECGDGWFNIIDSLCNCLQIYSGQPGKKQIVAKQVKEKFGTLKFYTNDIVDPGVMCLILFAENMSAVTCETCGKPGTLMHRGYIHTLCEECSKIEKNSWAQNVS